MTSLAQYPRLRAALAEASQINEVLSIRDEIEHVKLYAKQIEDKELLTEATLFQIDTEAKLGKILTAAKKAGLIREGRPAKNGKSNGPFPSLTLADLDVDKNLSARAQRFGAMETEALDNVKQSAKDRITSGRAKIIEAEPINGARSIMGSRVEPDDSLDYFPTPPWATRALIEVVLGKNLNSIWEPACGEGHMAEVLREYCADVTASDIHDYGYNDYTVDFLTCEHFNRKDEDVDWIITNSPFGDHIEQFVLHALKLAKIGIAMFVPLRWLETVGRYENIFRDNPPTCMAFFAERVNLCRGRWEPTGSTATAYIWLVWVKGKPPQPPFWIPPGQRKALTRADDAARFTSHPVIRKENYNPETGEITETAVNVTRPPLESAPPAEIHPPAGGADLQIEDWEPLLSDLGVGFWAEKPSAGRWIVHPPPDVSRETSTP